MPWSDQVLMRWIGYDDGEEVVFRRHEEEMFEALS